MKFSIITPTYNSANIVHAAVNSVLSQSFSDYEHIIIDNKSGDNTLEIIRSLYHSAGKTEKLVIQSEPDKGIADAFNKGIRLASGEYVLILNSDDSLYNSDVLLKIDLISKTTKYPLIHGDMYFEDETLGSNRRGPLLCPYYAALPYNHPGMFVKRSVYEKYGAYNTEYKIAMDYEFILRLELNYPDFRDKIFYFSEFPITLSRAGGASGRHELLGIMDIRRALREAGKYSLKARYHYWGRISRMRIRQLFHYAGLNFLIKLWRHYKWSKHSEAGK